MGAANQKNNRMTDFDALFLKKILLGPVRIRVKAGSRQTGFFGFNNDIFLVEVAAKPEDNKANDALERYFTRIVKAPVRIKSGFASKDKRVVLL